MEGRPPIHIPGYATVQHSQGIVRTVSTRSSAIADGPRNAMCQSNSCQLLLNSVQWCSQECELEHQLVKFDFAADLTGTDNRSEEVIK